MVQTRKATVAIRKLKAIGTPITTAKPSRPTKNTISVTCPRPVSHGPASHSTTAVAATKPMASAMSTTRPRKTRISALTRARPGADGNGERPHRARTNRAPASRRRIDPARIRRRGGGSGSGTAATSAIPNASAKPATRARHRRDESGQPHVAGPLDRDRGAEHRQPQEQDRRQFVGPDDGVVEHRPRHDADEEDADLRHDDRRGRGSRSPDEARSPVGRGRRRLRSGTRGKGS